MPLNRAERHTGHTAGLKAGSSAAGGTPVTVGKMRTSRSPERQTVVVYDLATVRFRRSAKGRSMSMIAASGETLAVVDTNGDATNEDAAYAACEHALNGARVRRNESLCRVALYNPYTAHISYLPAPDSVIFTNHEPRAIHMNGEIGIVHFDGEQHQLEISGVLIDEEQLTVSAASRAWDAHS